MRTIRIAPGLAGTPPTTAPPEPAPVEAAAPTLAELPPLAALPSADRRGEVEDLGADLARRLHRAGGGQGSDPVRSLLEKAPALFRSLGVRLDVVRTKEGCAVVRTTPETDSTQPCPCQLVAAFLTAVPRVALGVTGSLIENTCFHRGARFCLFTLIWEPGDGAALAVGSLPIAALEAPPCPPSTAEPEANGHAPSVAPPAPPPPPPSRGATAPEHTHAETTEPVRTEPERTDRASSAPGRRRARVGLQKRLPIPPWLIRRGWLLLVVMVAGVAGGTYAAKHEVVSYQAQSTLVVQSGASSTTGPGGAAEAEQLAITYATLIPTDSAVLDRAAARLGLSPQTVSGRLTVSVETGTAVFVVDYRAPTQAEAVAGSAVVASVVGGAVSSSSTIPAGTVSVVHLSTQATASGSLARYGKELGAILGLVLGLILVMAAERADRRVDTAAELATTVGCPSAAVLEDLSTAELTRAIALEPRAAGGVTLVPLAQADQKSSTVLASQLRDGWPSGTEGAPVLLSLPFESDPTAEAQASGPTVLVVSAGETVRHTAAVAARLQAVHRGPLWAVLVTRRARRKLVAGAR